MTNPIDRFTAFAAEATTKGLTPAQVNAERLRMYREEVLPSITQAVKEGRASKDAINASARVWNTLTNEQLAANSFLASAGESDGLLAARRNEIGLDRKTGISGMLARANKADQRISNTIIAGTLDLGAFGLKALADLGENDPDSALSRASQSIKNRSEDFKDRTTYYRSTEEKGGYQAVAQAAAGSAPSLVLPLGAAKVAGGLALKLGASANAAANIGGAAAIGLGASATYGSIHQEATKNIQRSVTPEMLKTSEHTSDMYGQFEQEGYEKGLTGEELQKYAYDRTVDLAAEDSANTWTLASMALEPLARGGATLAANRAGGQYVGQKWVEMIMGSGASRAAMRGAVAREAGKGGHLALNMADAGMVARQSAQEFLQEGAENYGGQRAAERLGGDNVDWTQVIKSGAMGALVGGSMGSGLQMSQGGSPSRMAQQQLAQLRQQHQTEGQMFTQLAQGAQAAEMAGDAKQAASLMQEANTQANAVRVVEQQMKDLGIPFESVLPQVDPAAQPTPQPTVDPMAEQQGQPVDEQQAALDDAIARSMAGAGFGQQQPQQTPTQPQQAQPATAATPAADPFNDDLSAIGAAPPATGLAGIAQRAQQNAPAPIAPVDTPVVADPTTQDSTRAQATPLDTQDSDYISQYVANGLAGDDAANQALLREKAIQGVTGDALLSVTRKAQRELKKAQQTTTQAAPQNTENAALDMQDQAIQAPPIQQPEPVTPPANNAKVELTENGQSVTIQPDGLVQPAPAQPPVNLPVRERKAKPVAVQSEVEQTAPIQAQPDTAKQTPENQIRRAQLVEATKKRLTNTYEDDGDVISLAQQLNQMAKSDDPERAELAAQTVDWFKENLNNRAMAGQRLGDSDRAAKAQRTLDAISRPAEPELTGDTYAENVSQVLPSFVREAKQMAGTKQRHVDAIKGWLRERVYADRTQDDFERMFNEDGIADLINGAYKNTHLKAAEKRVLAADKKAMRAAKTQASVNKFLTDSAKQNAAARAAEESVDVQPIADSQEPYRLKPVRTYRTKAGKVGAEIKESRDTKGRLTYAYMGEWGAGSVDADRMMELEAEWRATKRGHTIDELDGDSGSAKPADKPKQDPLSPAQYRKMLDGNSDDLQSLLSHMDSLGLVNPADMQKAYPDMMKAQLPDASDALEVILRKNGLLEAEPQKPQAGRLYPQDPNFSQAIDDFTTGRRSDVPSIEEVEAEKATKPKADEAPKQKGKNKTLIGQNNEGKNLYEDEIGIRYVEERKGVYMSEDVATIPTKAGYQFKPDNRTSEHMTVAEYAAQTEQKQPDAAPDSEQPTKTEAYAQIRATAMDKGRQKFNELPKGWYTQESGRAAVENAVRGSVYTNRLAIPYFTDKEGLEQILVEAFDALILEAGGGKADLGTNKDIEQSKSRIASWEKQLEQATDDSKKTYIAGKLLEEKQRLENLEYKLKLDTGATEQQAKTAQSQIVTHTTTKGKELRGIVRTDLSAEEAKAIDPYTFKKDDGYFIRESRLNEQPAPTPSKIDFNSPERFKAALADAVKNADTEHPSYKQLSHLAKNNLAPTGGFNSEQDRQSLYNKIMAIQKPAEAKPPLDAVKTQVADAITVQNTKTRMTQTFENGGDIKPLIKALKDLTNSDDSKKAAQANSVLEWFGESLSNEFAKALSNKDFARRAKIGLAITLLNKETASLVTPTRSDRTDKTEPDIAPLHLEWRDSIATARQYANKLISEGVLQRPDVVNVWGAPKLTELVAAIDAALESVSAPVQTEPTATQDSTNEPTELGQPSPRTLEGISADSVQGTEGERPTGSRATESSGTDLSGDGRTGESGLQRTRSMGDGAPDVPVSGGGIGAGSIRSDRSSGRSPQADVRQSGGDNTLAVVPAPQQSDSFVLTEQDKIGSGGAKTKFKGNVEAIRILKAVVAEGRKATREEQRKLAKFVGWGGLQQAFRRDDGSVANGWAKEVDELENLLTPDEYKAAVDSSIAAHYTSPEIVKGIWDAVKQLGFTGGRVLEPSMGSGNFFGMMPKDLRKSAQLHGVELDNITGHLAQQLYPEAKIKVMGFQDYAIPDGHFDLAIGNPPFGAIKITDASRPRISGLSLHNYFFAKSVDALAENGVLAMVVTNRLLDASNANDKARQYMAERTEFLGAIRLPNNAFAKNAGTEVTTDIIFLRKLTESERTNGLNSNGANGSHAWVNVRPYTDKNGKQVPLNEYFHKNPSMMLGEFGAYGSMYTPDDPALVAREGQNTPELMAQAIAKLPKAIMADRGQQKAEAQHEQNIADIPNVKVGSMFVQDGQVYVRQPDQLGERQAEPVEMPSAKALDRVTGMTEIRDALNQLRLSQLSDDTSPESIEADRAALNKVYDAFVKRNSYLNSDANKKLFRDDPSWPQLSSLEDGFDKGVSVAVAKSTGEQVRQPSAKKAAIFQKRTQFPYTRIESVSNAKDGMVESLNRLGQLDIGLIAQLYGKDEQAIVKELGDLIYQDPVYGWVTADEYLSGNVKKKLAQAKDAVASGEDLQRNVEALEKVQPADIEAVDIEVRAGSHWIPSKHVVQFIKDTLAVNSATAHYNNYAASWDVTTSAVPESSQTSFGTIRANAATILIAALNGKQITIYDQLPENKTEVNAEATAAANEKVEQVKRAWADWIWKDDARRVELARIYNDTFNTTVQQRFDGAHLSLLGKVDDAVIKLKPHQADAVWRITQTPTTLLDHVVGAGKTFTMIGAIMELRRMGKSTKPMLVVPNHLVGQWAADFQKLYPSANILAATKKDFDGDRRRRLFARIATGDWDAVIVAHSSFGKVPLSPEEEAEFMKAEIKDMMDAEARIRSESGKDSRNAKDIAKRRMTLEEKLKKLMAEGRKDNDNLYWHELGVDSVFVDEAHEFKNLAFSSGMQRVAGLGNQKGSQKAFDLSMKIKSIKSRIAGSKIVFATGTPISNTMAEMYTMQRYLDLDAMQEQGLGHFDAWAKMFGQVVSDWELSPAGKYKMNSRFAKFVNMPELMQRYLSFADVINRDDINRQLAAIGETLGTPKIKGNKPQNIVVERSDDQAGYIGEPIVDKDGNETYPEGTLVHRAENLPKKAEKGADNMLKIMSDARKAALDMRLIDPSLPDYEGSKTNEAVRRAVEIYKKWDADKGTQLIFCDLSTPKGAAAGEKARIEELIRLADQGDEEASEQLDKLSPDELDALNSNFSVYDDIKAKLIKSGIPEKEIAFIHDAKTEPQKDDLFGKVKSGRIRILLGSTSKMGAGTNVQDRLVALHHLDAPWRPSDLEQREGRIIRQGNEFYKRDPEGFEIEILRYATKQTLDSRMWQTLESKARFIEQVRKGDVTSRVIEDVGGEAANAAEMKAASSGNPLILEEMSLRRELQNLESEKSRHNREQHRIKDTIRSLVRDQSSHDRNIEELTQDMSVRVPEKFEITIGKKTFKQGQEGARDQAGELLKEAAIKSAQLKQDFKVGSYGDFDLFVQHYSLSRDSVQFIATSPVTGGKYSVPFTYAQDSAAGLITKIGNRLRSIPDMLKAAEDQKARDLAEIPKLESQLKDWSKADELEAKREQHKSIIDQLKPKQKPEKSDVDSATGAEMAEYIKAQEGQTDIRRSVAVWHGSPYEFDRFSLEHLGRGEGAQAFGWGLYFAGNRGVAEHYKKVLSSMSYNLDSNRGLNRAQVLRIAKAIYPDRLDGIFGVDVIAGMILATLEDGVPHSEVSSAYKNYPETYAAYNDLASRITGEGKAGKLYRVRLQPNESDFLSLDEPLFEQKQHIDKLKPILDRLSESDELTRYEEMLNTPIAEWTGGDLIKALHDAAMDDLLPYEDSRVDDAVNNGDFPKAVSMYLHSLGIAGNRYLDGMSRGKDRGYQNYVLFDDSAAEIIEAYNSKDTQPQRPADAGQTVEQVRNLLTERFGADVVAKLEANGKLVIVQSVADLPKNLTGVSENNDGVFIPSTGVTFLISDNLTSRTVIPTLLHEMGGHAGFQTVMRPETYAAIMQQFDKMVEAGNPLAVKAKQRAERAESNPATQRDEYLPYLITEASIAQDKKGGAYQAVMRLIDRAVAAVRAWAFDKLGVRLKLNPNDIVALAERMVKQAANPKGKPPTPPKGRSNADVQNSINPSAKSLADVRRQHEGKPTWMKAPNGKPTKLTEKQWLQVRTPEFKAWFGDWENDPANASKVVDANGEPMVVYHGTVSEFNAFDPKKGMAIWSSETSIIAEEYSISRLEDNNGEGTPRVISGFIKAQNRFDADLLPRLIGSAGEFFAAAIEQAKSNGKTSPAAEMRVKDAARQLDDSAKKKGIRLQDHPIHHLWFAPDMLFGDGGGDKIKTMLSDIGFDSIQFTERKNVTFGVLSPTQIKSATDNTGDFDGSNPDIRFSEQSRSRIDMHFKDVVKRTPELQEAAKKLQAGEITAAEYDRLVDKYKPVEAYTSVPKPATREDLERGLTSEKVEKIGIPSQTLEDGYPVGLRLDIPAYSNHGVWVVSVHEQQSGFAAGKSIGYESVAIANNATFGVVQNAALNIAGGKPKATIAVMKGDWVNTTPDEAYQAAVKALKSDQWVQVGMDPERHSYFYDRANMRPVESAEQIIQVGALVMAKNPVYGDKTAYRFSRRDTEFEDAPVTPTNFKDRMKRRLREDISQGYPAHRASEFIRRWLGTPLHLSLTEPQFKPVFTLIQERLNHVSAEASHAIEVAPEILGRRETFADFRAEVKNAGSMIMQGKYTQDMQAAAKVLFDGTLIDKKVYSDAELTSKGLTADQVKRYREMRAAINTSLDQSAKAHMSKVAMFEEVFTGEEIHRLHDQDLSVAAHREQVKDKIKAALKALDPKKQEHKKPIKRLEDALTKISDINSRLGQLKFEGYAPLMRFGQHDLRVVDSATGDTVLYEMFETKRERDRARDSLIEANLLGDKYEMTTKTKNPEEYKLFREQGINPETFALFSKVAGLDSDQAYQAYLKLATAPQSAMRRLIHRKGIAGFSENTDRVMAAFVISNARRSANMLYSQDIESAVMQIDDGELQGYAQKLVSYINDPVEEMAALRSFLFFMNMGFSLRYGLLNLTQPYIQTLPELTRYVPAGRATKIVTSSSGTALKSMSDDNSIPAEFQDDYKMLKRKGFLEPQNIWALQGRERGRSATSSVIDVTLHLSGIIAQFTETVNRRTAMIAALRTAKIMGADKLKAEGFDSAYDFAAHVIQSTQGVMNKGNRPQAARGLVGAPLFVFRTFSIQYVEQMIRMIKNPQYAGERDELRKALLLLMLILFGLAGATGLPFAKDLLDIFETGMSLSGNPVNFEREVQQVFGKEMAEPILYGAVNGFVFDMHGSTSMGDMLPATRMFHPDTEAARGLLEIGGATGGFLNKMGDSGSLMMQGKVGDGVVNALPRFATSIGQGTQIATTGEFRTQYGNKLTDGTAMDAVLKIMDMNPSGLAQQGRIRMLEREDLAIRNAAQQKFRNRLIEAYEESDQAKIREIRADIADWNKDNPQYPVKIDYNRSIKPAIKRRNKTWQERTNVPDGMEWMQDLRPD